MRPSREKLDKHLKYPEEPLVFCEEYNDLRFEAFIDTENKRSGGDKLSMVG